MFKPPEAFEIFWKAYPASGPRKTGKSICRMVWERRNLDEQAEHVLDVLDAMKRTDDWLADNGKYIPKPINWLNDECYDCDLEDIEAVPKQYRDFEEVKAAIWPEAPSEVESHIRGMVARNGESWASAATRLIKAKERATG